MADPYRPELTPGKVSLWFNPPPVCHHSHWGQLENKLMELEHVDSAWIDHQCGIEISYSEESEYLAAVVEADTVLRYFNKARFAKPAAGSV